MFSLVVLYLRKLKSKACMRYILMTLEVNGTLITMIRKVHCEYVFIGRGKSCHPSKTPLCLGELNSESAFDRIAAATKKQYT